MHEDEGAEGGMVEEGGEGATGEGTGMSFFVLMGRVVEQSVLIWYGMMMEWQLGCL